MAELNAEVPGLEPFLLSNVRPTGVRIGAGSYGSVDEVAIRGALGAAKRIHDIFQDRSEIPESEILRATAQFVRECQLMSTFRHPNIVQFLGVCFLPGARLPALVMERMLTSLHDLLDPETDPPPPPDAPKPFFPLSLKCSILHNVACGLAYLHERSPPVIHRDLSARNVLLNSGMVAKIADLGVARIVPRMRAAATMTKGPGAIVYMPPEAMEDKLEEEGNDEEEEKSKAKYDASIDIFSFGVVAIFTLCQSFPNSLLPTAYREGGRLLARTELERRERYMRVIYGQLREQHPIIQMIEGCLGFPEERPSVSEALRLLEEARAEVRDEQVDMNKLELVRALQTQPRNQGNAEVHGELRRMEAELAEAQQQLREKEELLQFSEREKLTATQNLTEAHQQLRQMEELVESSERQQQRTRQDLAATRRQLRQMEQRLTYCEEEKMTVRGELAIAKQQLTKMNEQLQSINREKTVLQQQVQSIEREKQTLRQQLISSQRWIQELRQKETESGQIKDRELAHIQQQLKQKEELLYSSEKEKQKVQEQLIQKEASLVEAQQLLRLKKDELRSSEALLADFQNALQQRDSQTQRTKTQPSDVSTAVHDPHSAVKSTKLSLHCHHKRAAPERMNRGSATTDGRFVYFTLSGSTSAYQYDFTSDKWNQLPSCPFCGSGLAMVAGELTAMGGYDGPHFTNKLVTLRQGKWVEEYPPMVTVRSSPAVVSTSDDANVIVIGGGQGTYNGCFQWTTSVELFRVESRSWGKLTDLPQPLHRPSATITGHQLSVIGTGTNGYSCSIQSLPSSHQPIASQTSPQTLHWKFLPPLPVRESTVATLCGQFIVVGGWRGQSPVNSIHQLMDGQWVVIGSMASGRWYCLVASPSPGRIVIAGGMGSEGCVEECVAT